MALEDRVSAIERWMREVDHEREEFKKEWRPLLHRLQVEREIAHFWHTLVGKALVTAVGLSSIGAFTLALVRAVS